MAKQSKSGRSSKKNLQQNAAWLEERLESTMLDLDALSSMPIEEVNAELKPFKQDQTAFVASLNEKLPAGASIPEPESTVKKTRRKPQTSKAGDRNAAAPQKSVTRRSSRLFGIKSAIFLSLLIIAGALFVPKLIRDLREDRLESATSIEDDSAAIDPTKPPTWIEGPAVDELIRGVKYTIAGIEQVVLDAPLPGNPGELIATFQLRATINGAGKVVRLEPLLDESTVFEPVVIDSLLRWKFSTLSDTSQLNDAVITIEYLIQ